MELRSMHPTTIVKYHYISVENIHCRNSVKCSCAILSLHPFQKLAVFRLPHNNNTHTHTLNEFSEFELILSHLMDVQHFISFSRKYTACNVRTPCDINIRCNDDDDDQINKYKMEEQNLSKPKKMKSNIGLWNPEPEYLNTFALKWTMNATHACMQAFIHFESNEMIYSYRLRCTMQILDEFYGLRLLRIEFNNNNNN